MQYLYRLISLTLIVDRSNKTMSFQTKKVMKFKTRHEVFDEITNLRIGHSISVFDETHTESILFLNSLLSKQKSLQVYVLSPTHVETPFKVRNVDITRSLNDVNLSVAEFRGEIQRGIIIHHYLPRVLLKENEEAILQMLEYWSNKIADKKFIEFFTLPKETFPSFERKLQALANGVIRLDISKQEESYRQTFMVLRGSKPQYHITEFPYRVDNNRLLIFWEGEYTERLPKETEVEIKRIKSYLMENQYSIKIDKKEFIHSMNPYEYLLFSEIVDKRLDEIQMLFPERIDDVLETLAKWKIAGYIGFREMEKLEHKPLKGKLNLFTKIGLKIPTFLSLLALRLQGTYGEKRIRKVPLDGYVSLKNSAEAVARIFLPPDTRVVEKLPDIESFFLEMAGRRTALEHIEALGENSSAQLDVKYVPKLCSLALSVGYDLKSNIKVLNPNTYELTIKNCFICRGSKSEEPICQMLGSTLVGTLSILIKEKFTWHEIKCQAMGDDNCVFLFQRGFE